MGTGTLEAHFKSTVSPRIPGRLQAQYVLWRDGKAGVLVRDGQHATWRDLTLGLSGKETIEITSGLDAGEGVVAAAGTCCAGTAQ